MAETLIFLKLCFDGQQVVGGGAEVSGFVDQIEIESFSWGVSAKHNETNQQKSTRDETPLKMNSIELTKFYDQASVKITTGASKRRHVESAVLTFATLAMVEGAQAPSRLMEMEMKDGFIERVRLQASESGKSIAIKEDFTLSFRQLRLSYWPVADGALSRKGAVKVFSYDAPRVAA